MISDFKFEQLLKKGYSLDILWIVQKAKSGEPFENIPSPRIQNITDTALRKGLITSEFKVTLEGEELLKFVESEEEVKLVKKRVSLDPFKAFWDTFPSSDTFEYRGRKFEGSRGLKQKKEDCRIKLNKILNEGDFTIEQIIKCLKLEVHQKQEKSYKEGKNHMSFMQNSCTWLNQKTFEGYIELIKKEEPTSTEFYG